MRVLVTTNVWLPLWLYLFPVFELKDEESFQAGRQIFMHTYISDLKALNKVCNTNVFISLL